MPSLSAITISKNEASNIAACLDSVAFCDERVVVDCGSEDDTVRLAEQHGARVIHHPWTDFGKQKNIALSHAKGDWVLDLDADEIVTPALAAQIRQAVLDGSADAYEFPRLSTFCEREMWHSGYPDYVLRLFRRTRGRFSDHPVHTRFICDGPVARLSEPLIHHPVRVIGQALAKMDAYSTAGAEELISSGRRVTFATGILRGLWTFFRLYVLRLGFLDGREGFLLAVVNAEGCYYRYMKAWLRIRRDG